MAVPPSPSRVARRPGILLWLILATVLVFLLYVGWSTTFVSPLDIIRELFAGNTGANSSNVIVWELRLPRALGTVCVGGLLATVGCAFQGLLRNPLADPFVVGVSSGAALGGVAAVLGGFASALGGLAMPLCGFVGGLLALALVLGFSTTRNGLDVRTLLLAGVVTGSMLSALLSLCLLWSGHDSNELLKFLLGDTSNLLWNKVLILAVVLLVGFVVLFRQSRALNAFAIGEQTALRLGIETKYLKAIVLVVGAAMTSAAVSMVGIVGFVGLVAPHMARRLAGTDWRKSMPASLVLGMLLLLASDLIAQRLMDSRDLPLGVVTAILGSPFLLVMLRKA